MSCTRLQTIIDISKLPPRHKKRKTSTDHGIKRTNMETCEGTYHHEINLCILLTEKFAVVTLYSYFPALFDQTINIAWELVSNVNASVTMDQPEHIASKSIDSRKYQIYYKKIQEITLT